MSNNQLADTGIHDQILKQRVAIVAEADDDFLVALSIHVNSVVLDTAFSLLIDSFCDCEAEFLDVLENAHTTRRFTHDHLHVASGDEVAIDLLNGSENRTE